MNRAALHWQVEAPPPPHRRRPHQRYTPLNVISPSPPVLLSVPAEPGPGRLFSPSLPPFLHRYGFYDVSPPPKLFFRLDRRPVMTSPCASFLEVPLPRRFFSFHPPNQGGSSRLAKPRFLRFASLVPVPVPKFVLPPPYHHPRPSLERIALFFRTTLPPPAPAEKVSPFFRCFL